MYQSLLVYLQYILPQQLLSQLFGLLAESRNVAVKNWLIKQFMRRYKINLQEAVLENSTDYATFNDFFIRRLKPVLRPIASDANSIISPVDGSVAAIGQIKKNQLLQTKAMYFNLENLLGQDENLAQQFFDGEFATFYLAPNNYHRVHMPISGKLTQTIYVPGKLFSVNRMTTDLIPNLYSRNERLICLFTTTAGPMAIIMVGAMIVGNMKTVWMEKSKRTPNLVRNHFADGVFLQKGDELGYFKLGSTVIVLFPKNSITWQQALQSGSPLQYGKTIGTLNDSLISTP